MKIFIDESGNEGHIHTMNSIKQPCFVNGIVKVDSAKDEMEIRNEFSDFLNKYGISIEEDFKGIFTRKYNIMLEEFIDEFLSKNSVYGLVYDKRFYISSQIALFIFGLDFQKNNTHHFYKFVELVSMAEDDFYVSLFQLFAGNDLDKERLKETINLLIVIFEKNASKHFSDLLTQVFNDDKFLDFLLENQEPLLLKGSYDNKNYSSVINLNSLGESLIVVDEKIFTDSSKSVIVVHDEIAGYDKIFQEEFKFFPHIHLDVENKPENILLLQYADMISNSLFRIYKNILNMINGGLLFNVDKKWELETYSKILNTIKIENIKWVIPPLHFGYMFAVMKLFNPNVPPNKRNIFFLNEYTAKGYEIFTSRAINYKDLL